MKAMEVVVAQAKELNMVLFYENEELLSPNTTIHNCETAACICGYAVLDEEVREIVKSDDPNDVWTMIEDELKSSEIADSIFDCWADTRKRAAPIQLLDHPHLNSESDAATALDYLKQVRELSK